jgi:hypothetical protein
MWRRAYQTPNPEFDDLERLRQGAEAAAPGMKAWQLRLSVLQFD